MSIISILCYFLDILWRLFGGVPVLGDIIDAIGSRLCD